MIINDIATFSSTRKEVKFFRKRYRRIVTIKEVLDLLFHQNGVLIKGSRSKKVIPETLKTR